MQKKTMKAHILVVFGYVLVLGFALYIVAFPVVDGITPRSYVNMVVADTWKMREQIAKKISTGDPLSDTGKFYSLAGEGTMPIDFGWITEKGSIVIYNKQYGVVLIQEPVKNEKGVAWSFIIYPDDLKVRVYMP
ncbi:hypothetical protein AGMMS49960_18940 [Betaproteobacteria bacterium]|nr:hypothetical protein AGMMS49960_18940 [Betaproteobacteria bacterium]